jgi:C1A family cysteine protease
MPNETQTENRSITEQEPKRWVAKPSPFDKLDTKQKSLMLGAMPTEPPPTTLTRALVMDAHATDYPKLKDWRNINGVNYVTPVKSQGLCQSCVAFSIVAALETAIRIVQKQPTLDIDLSEAHLFYCHNDSNSCQNGWWPTAGLDFVKNKGVAPESFYPYAAGNQACLVSGGWESQKVQITGWRNITDIPDIKNWIDDNGPVVAVLEIFTDMYSYGSGIYHRGAGTTLGWHSVCVVGYNDIDNYWICKNCWGAEFGDNGYINIAYGECSIEAYGMFAIEGIVQSRWVKGKKVQALWANNKELNAWAYIESEGWRKITAANRQVFFQILMQLIQAKNKGTNVNVRIYDTTIREIYS